jgi:HAMP domain-containing protein
MSETSKVVLVALVVVLLVLLALDVLRRRQLDPIGSLGRSIVAAFPPSTMMTATPPAPTQTDGSTPPAM